MARKTEEIRRAVAEALQDPSVLQVLAGIIQDTVVTELRKTIEENSTVIKNLQAALEAKDKTIAELECKIDDIEQYQRRQCLRIFGIKEENDEDTDEIALKVAKDIGVDLSVTDIDRSHRVGRKNEDRPRPIIVKFCSYRQRHKMYQNKKLLKGSGVTLREDLTRARHNLLKDCISRYGLHNVWTQDGAIIVKSGDARRRITKRDDM